MRLPVLPAVIVLMILYMTSLVGLTNANQQSWYLSYTPVLLWINAILLLLYHNKWNQKTALGILASVGIVVILEWLLLPLSFVGLQNFDANLGANILAHPWSRLAYWWILFYSSSSLAEQWLSKQRTAALGLSLLLFVSLTAFVEWVATQQLTLWEFAGNQGLWIGLFLATLGQLAFYLTLKQLIDYQSNKVSIYVYGGLWIFFVGLFMFLP